MIDATADPRHGQTVADDTDLVWRYADELKVGDMIDLYGDEFADPDKDDGKAYEFELAEVLEIERETDDCVAVGITNALIGFPVKHLLKTKVAS